MLSPVFPDTSMGRREIEPGLWVYECPKSAGLWIPLQSYLDWTERRPRPASAPSVEVAATVLDDSKQPALMCPESGRLLLRYRVGHGLQFHLDRSPATGGVWLDKGEWEALRSKGLHMALNLIFTASYQRQVRSAQYLKAISDTFEQRIGSDDFSRVSEFAAWLENHPKRRDIYCYLSEKVGRDTDVPGRTA